MIGNTINYDGFLPHASEDTAYLFKNSGVDIMV